MSHVTSAPSQVTDSCWVWARQKTPAENVKLGKIGKWMLFLNMKIKDSSGLTELDRTWFSIVGLVEKNALHGAKCSTSMSGLRSDDSDDGVIICYTADYTDVAKVREAAEAIHKVARLMAPIYYKTDEATFSGTYTHLGHKNVSMYRFCPDLRLYKRGGASGSSWILVENDSPKGTGESFVPSEVQGTPPGSLIPSKVNWQRWLWAGPEVDPYGRDPEHDKAGKWMLFLDQEDKDSNGLTELDKAWSSVARLVDEGILLSAKCCTAVTPSYKNPDIGLIACFMSDYTDKVKVKEAADAICNSIKVPGNIYFKTELSSREGSYGDEKVSIYKYSSPDCKFHERDEELAWKLVVID